MTSATIGGRWRATHPIVAGAVVGLLTGLVGLAVTWIAASTVAGGLVGAVGCGVTVAYRSDEGRSVLVAHAVIADVASSVAFFLLVLASYLASVWLTEGLAVVSAVWFSTLYLVFGGLFVAVPVAVLSLGLAGLAAVGTSLLERRLAGSNPRG